uniref:Uncharacterized protein n=1 Tax=Avena sativa TaxID=4498 RepID=A0ACD5X9S0_AVESA
MQVCQESVARSDKLATDCFLGFGNYNVCTNTTLRWIHSSHDLVPIYRAEEGQWHVCGFVTPHGLLYIYVHIRRRVILIPRPGIVANTMDGVVSIKATRPGTTRSKMNCLRSSRRLVLSCRPSSGAVRALPPQPMMLNTRYYSRLAASERPNIFGSIIPTSLSRHVCRRLPAPASFRRRYCTSDPGPVPRFDRWYHKPCKVAAAAALASAATAAAAVCSRYDREIVPYTNRTHLVFMSPQSEIALWEPISIEEKKLWASQSQIVDPLHPDSVRVRLIADKVLRATYRTLDIESHKDDFKKDAKPQTRHLDGLNWEVILIKDDDANLAIEASPDGKIIVYTRLLDYFNTDAEIAFAIAQVVGLINF